MPERNQAELEELAALLANYLKALSPDWSDERIATEVQAVFEERKLFNSKRRRQAFKEKLLTQLEEIRTHPDDWFLRKKG
ncbi:MAG: hypothetical protein KDJ65_34915 [Anaerolineae bacterium]|nr:hypothetical protein [Anaerolineae bacterium]